MIQPRPWMRQLLWISSALLVACGGDQTPDPQPEPYVQQYNTYLPLAVGASLRYADTNVGSLESLHILDSALSQQAGMDVFEVTLDSANQTFSFFLSSDEERILLYGLDGPIMVDNNGLAFELDELRFDSPLVLERSGHNLNSGHTLASASLAYNGVQSHLTDIDIQYQTISVDNLYQGAYGTLPVRAALFRADVTAVVQVLGQSIEIEETLSNTLLFTKGIGIVRHTGTYVSEEHTYNSELTALNNLPRTIWFDYNNGRPRLASGASNVFQIAGQGNISSNDYALANLERINQLGWIQLQNSNGRYSVTLPGGASLPQHSTSVEVVFEHRVTARRLSANVTLLVP
ncbi:MAG: hypothetical protein VYA55_05715 [Pseudomonadota bacterium]|nr:hypothetical protein [Pseudomonadota bacterium]